MCAKKKNVNRFYYFLWKKMIQKLFCVINIIHPGWLSHIQNETIFFFCYFYVTIIQFESINSILQTSRCSFSIYYSTIPLCERFIPARIKMYIRLKYINQFNLFLFTFSFSFNFYVFFFFVFKKFLAWNQLWIELF